MALILEERCIPTCVGGRVRGDIEAKCPGMLGSIDLGAKAVDLVKCACHCHNEDSGDLNEEQELWVNKMMVSTIRVHPFRPCYEVMIGLEWAGKGTD